MLDNMKGLMAYSGLATKVRAMQGHLLTQDDFLAVVHLPDIPAVAAWLRQKPSYAAVLKDLNAAAVHRGELEPHLRESVYQDFAKIYRFADKRQREFLQLYSMRYETAFLKECLQYVLGLRAVRPDPLRLERHLSKASRLPFRDLAAASSLQELAGHLEKTPYHAPLSAVMTAASPTLFDCETALDLCCFSRVWRERKNVVSRADLPGLTEFCGAEFDMLNLMWIRRCKKYYSMTPAEIIALLIPIEYRLRQEERNALAEAASTEELDLLIEKTWYGRHFTGLSGETLEADHSRILKEILTHEAVRCPYSISAVYSYLYQKEHEADRLIIALECVRYQVPAEEAMLYLSTR